MLVFTRTSLGLSCNGYYCIITALRQNKTYHWKQIESDVSSDTECKWGFRASSARHLHVCDPVFVL
jgi:hypothetical protein